MNNNPSEGYSLPLPPMPKVEGENIPSLPIPKLSKINNKNFCIVANNTITIFHYISEEEKSARKIKNTFLKRTLTEFKIEGLIKFVYGNETDCLYVCSKS